MAGGEAGIGFDCGIGARSAWAGARPSRVEHADSARPAAKRQRTVVDFSMGISFRHTLNPISRP